MYKEILHNISRHSHAKHVGIAVEITPGKLLLRVQDDGVGFDEGLTRAGNGLTNLRRRTTDLGGTLDIQSAPGGGTKVTVSAPIP
jgi:signal transduction histidine kinase